MKFQNIIYQMKISTSTQVM